MEAAILQPCFFEACITHEALFSCHGKAKPGAVDKVESMKKLQRAKFQRTQNNPIFASANSARSSNNRIFEISKSLEIIDMFAYSKGCLSRTSRGAQDPSLVQPCTSLNSKNINLLGLYLPSCPTIFSSKDILWMQSALAAQPACCDFPSASFTRLQQVDERSFPQHLSLTVGRRILDPKPKPCLP